MRKLLWVTLGFGAACAMGAYLWIDNWALLFAGGFLLLALVGSLLAHRQQWAGALGMLCLGIALGLCWFRIYDGVYLGPARSMDGETAQVTVEISDFSWNSNYGTVADGWVHLDGRPYHVRCYMGKTEALRPGDKVTMNARFRLTTDGGGQERTYHRSSGIFLLLYGKGSATMEKASNVPLKYFPAVLRQGILGLTEAVFPVDCVAFVQALLVGNRQAIDYETNTAFCVSGISHIIAVSGLHVSILFSLIYLIAGKRRWPTALLGIPLVLLFAAVVGFSPSVTRAAIMQILMMLSLLLEREYDPPTALAAAALVILVCNPLAASSISFQMSVGCMAGIFLVSGRIRRWLLADHRLGPAKGKGLRPRLKRWIAASVSVTLGATCLTTPLVAYYFGTVSLVGLLTNLLTLWAVSLVFYGAMAVCLAGVVWLPLAKGIAWVVAFLVRYVLLISRTLAKFPLAAVYTQSPYVVIWLVFCYLLVLLSLHRGRKLGAVLCCGAVGLSVALLLSWAEPLTGNARMTVLDVGQGQCILLQSQGRTFMVDCGGSRDTQTADLAAETLLSQGICRLDGVILTHYDWDHAGGLPYFLSRIPTDGVFLPDIPEETAAAQEIGEASGVAPVLVGENLEVTWGDASLTIYAPAIGKNRNDGSLAVLFRTESCAILITGDRSAFGERQLLKQPGIGDVDVLVVGHHGSASSTCRELLEAVTPETAMISVGEGNAYGHPSEQTLDLLAEFGCQVYRTDICGTVVYRG